MKLHVEWDTELKLTHRYQGAPSYWCDLDDIPDRPGIYIFARRFGDGLEALYIGKANALRGRIKNQFNNLKLMHHVETAKSGQRVLLIGEFVPKKGQQLVRCLSIFEKAIIRHYLYERHDIVNIKGTKISRHELSNGGKYNPVKDVINVDN